MIIQLPEHFTFYDKLNRCIAKVEDGILKLDSFVSMRELMYSLTLAIKGTNCYYCGKKLSEKDLTMDHLYPQDLGGPTIPNNLVPCCSKCNSKKGNMTELQFQRYLKKSDEERRIMKEEFRQQNESRKIRQGYFMPREWIYTTTPAEILANITIKEPYLGRRYGKIKFFYEQYKHLPYPIIIDMNNYLLDGFLVLMFAKNNGIKRVPTIKLENVEVMINKKA